MVDVSKSEAMKRYLEFSDIHNIPNRSAVPAMVPTTNRSGLLWPLKSIRI